MKLLYTDALRFSYRGLVPETIWSAIPRELYREDCEVTLEVVKNAGKFASLAGLTLYQLYPYRQGKEGGIQTASVSLPLLMPKFNVVGPSLSPNNIKLSLILPEMKQTRLRVYDLRGALIKELAVNNRPGTHIVVWDGADSQGRPAPTGVYFCHLEYSGSSQVRKVVLTR